MTNNIDSLKDLILIKILELDKKTIDLIQCFKAQSKLPSMMQAQIQATNVR